MKKLIFLALISLSVQGQAIQDVYNAAFQPIVSSGSLATVVGSGFGTQTGSPPSGNPTSLFGVSVQVNGMDCPLLYVSPTQINFQIPYEAAYGAGAVTVTVNGSKSATFGIELYQSAMGIFADMQSNAVAQNQDGSLNTPRNPAAPGSVIVVYLVGIGELDNPVGTGKVTPASPLSQTYYVPKAQIGYQDAPVRFLGLTPGFLGLAQANLLVPALKDGLWPVTIYLQNGNSNSPNVAIAANGVQATSQPGTKGEARK